MTITKERAQFIANLANDQWVDELDEELPEHEFDESSKEWSRKTDEFLAQVRDPEELYLFAKLWNWDGGLDEMRIVAEHPVCEQATALMLFWRAGADYYARRSYDELKEHQLDAYELVQQIQVRYLAGSYVSGKLSYDPAKDGYTGKVDVGPTDEAAWRIAPQMCQPVG